MSNPTSAVTSIRGLAERVAVYRALDLLLFEHIGRWITDDVDGSTAGVRPYAAAWSQHHAWHAELWCSRFPSIPDADVHAATDAARTRLADVEHVLATTRGVAGVAVFAEVVLPQLVAAVTEHLRSVDAALDAPTARVLELVLTDLERDRAAAQQLIVANDWPGPPADALDLDLATALTGA